MAVSEKSEQVATPEEQVDSGDSADNREHHQILSAAEAAQKDAVHIKLSWRSWVSPHLPPERLAATQRTDTIGQVVVLITCFAQVKHLPTKGEPN